MSDISLFLSDINGYLNTQITSAPLNRRVYKFISRRDPDKFFNKDFSDNSNIQKFTSYSPFTVSNGNVKASYRSIQEAIDAAAATGARETVLVVPGTYDEDIILRDNVNIEGFSPAFEIDTHMTVLTGNITSQLSDNEEITIARLSYLPTVGNTMTFAGTNAIRIVLNGMTIKSQTMSSALVSTNANMLAICNNCIISGNDIAAELAGQVFAFRACVLGDLIPGVATPRIIINSGVCSVIYCNGHIKFETGATVQLIVGNSFFNGTDPIADLDGGTMIMMNSAYLGGPGNLITGTGNFVDGGNAILGPTTFAAGITTIPASFDVKSSGSYLLAITENTGASNSALLTAIYGRSGRRITVDFRIEFDSDNTDIDIDVSLPFGTNNFTGINDAIGQCTLVGQTSNIHITGTLSAVASSQLVKITAPPTGSVESVRLTGTFSYIDSTM